MTLTSTPTLGATIIAPIIGVPAKDANKTARILQTAILIEQQVEGGHCFMQEHPEQTAQRVLDFLLPRA